MAYENTFMRKEIKYLLTGPQLRALQADIAPYMQADSYGLHTIHNIYCDTADYLLIRRSLEKPVYKEKLRLRSYGVQNADDTVFLELKKKYKGIVYKRRQELTLREAGNYLWHGILPQADTQVLREIDATVQREGLHPTVYIAYDRLAYFGRQDMEFRLTLDANIRWRTENLYPAGGDDTPLVLPAGGAALLEIKAADAMPLWMAHILARHGLAPTSFSKYGAIYETMQQQTLQNKERKLCLKVS